MRHLLAALLLLQAPAALAARVAVVQSDTLPPYTAPVEAFAEALGPGVAVEVYNLHGREKEAETLAARFRDDPPDAVFALGAKAAWIVNERTPSIPLVYAAILSPSRFDIEGRGTAGVSMVADPARAVSEVAGFFPNLRTLAVLRGPGIPDARIEAMQAAAGLVGLELRVERVRGPRDVRTAFTRLSDEVDAIWLQADREVLDRPSYRFVVEEAQRTRTPLVVETENMVRAGGLFAVVPDPVGVGREAAGRVRAALDGETLDGSRSHAAEVDLVLHLGRAREADTGFDELLLDFVDVVVE